MVVNVCDLGEPMLCNSLEITVSVYNTTVLQPELFNPTQILYFSRLFEGGRKIKQLLTKLAFNLFNYVFIYQ